MIPKIACALACLLGALLVGTPADAGHSGSHRQVIRLEKPVTGDRSARLKGSAPGRTAVRLERRSGGRWVDVRRLSVRHGRYHTSARVRPVAQVYRIKAGSSTSRARTVAARVVPADACRRQPRKANGSYWSCSFVDDLSTTALDRTKWLVQATAAW